MTPPPITLTRTNTILYCSHWQETVDFYRRLLRFPVAFENKWFVEFQLMDHSYLSIVDAARATIASVAGQGITLTWQVADLEGVHSYLQAQGIAATQIQHIWRSRVFYCHDPEGHRLEFWAQETAAPSA